MPIPSPSSLSVAGLRPLLRRAQLRLADARDPAQPIVRRIRAARLTYLDEGALLELARAVRAADARGVPGDLIEAGCALGGSAIVMAGAKAAERRLVVYDAFGMIPPPSDEDGPDVHARFDLIASGGSPGIGGNRYYGYEPDLQATVRANFAAHGRPIEASNVALVAGLFADTIYPTGPVALAHIDGDWYASVGVCLERIDPWLSVGGCFILDDYDHWSGARRAADEFLEANPGRYRIERRGRVHLVRVA